MGCHDFHILATIYFVFTILIVSGLIRRTFIIHTAIFHHCSRSATLTQWKDGIVVIIIAIPWFRYNSLNAYCSKLNYSVIITSIWYTIESLEILSWLFMLFVSFPFSARAYTHHLSYNNVIFQVYDEGNWIVMKDMPLFFCRGGDRYGAQLLSRGYSFMFIEGAPKKNRKPHTTGPKPYQLKTPTPKKPNLRPQNPKP